MNRWSTIRLKNRVEALTRHRLGYAYHIGKGVKQDYAAAVEWYRKAAAQGNADAQRKLDILARQASPGKK